jgi:hypothetical protein
MFQGIILKKGDILITSKITKIVPDDYTDPDLELVNPYILLKSIADNIYMKPYISEYSNQTIFSFRSDDILTMFSPKERLIDEYKKLTGFGEQLELDVTNLEEGE